MTDDAAAPIRAVEARAGSGDRRVSTRRIEGGAVHLRFGVRDVQVDWLKWPETPYRTTPMSSFGHDDLGEWLYAPRGAAASYHASGPAPLPVNFLSLVPRDSVGWIATWMWGNSEVDIDVYVDLVADPEWISDSVLKVVDLDLDVIRYRDGRTILDDEDEFEVNRVRLGYPEPLAASARTVAEELLYLVERSDPPFDTPNPRWLRLVAEKSAEDPDLPPPDPE